MKYTKETNRQTKSSCKLRNKDLTDYRHIYPRYTKALCFARTA